MYLKRKSSLDRTFRSKGYEIMQISEKRQASVRPAETQARSERAKKAEEEKSATNASTGQSSLNLINLHFRRNKYVSPSDEMNKRWHKILDKSLPTIDLIDIAAEEFSVGSYKRQFAPEYSYTSYLSML